MKKTNENIIDLYTKLRGERDKYTPLWQTIGKFVGIGVDSNYIDNKQSGREGDQLDSSIDDPTSAIAVQQAGDYLMGIIWGTGDGVFDLEPSDYALEHDSMEAMSDWFRYGTKTLLTHMNHSEAGLNSAMKPVMYDQMAFGTSGIGTFPNKAFKEGREENLFVFRGYGVDNIVCDVGKNGLIETVGVVYQWRTTRVIAEFAMVDGVFSEKLFAKLPKQIQDAHTGNDVNQTFTIVCMIYPSEDFHPKYKGKRGAKYIGSWFLIEDKDIFSEEQFKDKPIAIARSIVVRGEIFGRSAGTMLISSIRAINHMVGQTIMILEKQADPAVGVIGNSIAGDQVLDTSPGKATPFNAALLEGKNPIFPIHDIGDPTGIINYLIPYLNDKVTTAFKIDVLLDFNSAKDMTATESMQRYAIRGRSLAGIIQQMKIELLEPMIARCASIALEYEVLGVNPEIYVERAEALAKEGKIERLIPQGVLQCIKDGKKWYKVKFKNELDKLPRTEKIEALIQIINATMMIAQAYPAIIEAVDWHKLLTDINENLDNDSQYIGNADEFKAKIQQMAQMQQGAQQLGALESASKTGKTLAEIKQMEGGGKK
jgi:hypothetical protein